MAQEEPQNLAAERIKYIVQMCKEDDNTNLLNLLDSISTLNIRRQKNKMNVAEFAISQTKNDESSRAKFESGECLNFKYLDEVIEDKLAECREKYGKAEVFCRQVTEMLKDVSEQVSAAESKFQKLVKYEMQKLDPLDTRDLCEACDKGELLAVKYWLNLDPSLLEARRPLDVDHPYLPLHRAAMQGNPDIVEFLLKQRANVHKAVSVNKMVALHFACGYGRLEVARMLLDNGAHIEALDVQEQTPLHWAARSGNLQVVKLLRDRGANLFAESNNTMTAATKAETRGFYDIFRYLREQMQIDREKSETEKFNKIKK